MGGTAKKRPPVGTGMADPRATEVVGDRTGGVWLILANRWTSTIASNCAEYSAGKRWKASRSEDDDVSASAAICNVLGVTPIGLSWLRALPVFDHVPPPVRLVWWWWW